MKNKVMLLTNVIEQSPSGGRELLCKLNYEALRGLYHDNLTLFELEKSGPSGLWQMAKAFKGYIDGLNTASIGAMLDIVRERRIDTVFIDGSNLGKAAKAVKNSFPHVKVFTFFHNVESVFFWGAFWQGKSLHALAVCLINYIAERKSVRFSDRLICLSERDSTKLHEVYGRYATDVSAIALKDSFVETPSKRSQSPSERYALFVGGVFYANLSGILWYARHVAPRIGVKTYVVGRGFEQYREQLEQHGNIQVIGGVDSVTPWYEQAEFVVAPIFGGSGMKTKVAEALMYGKIVVGTSEAFSGYERIINRAGVVCQSAEDFITAIEAVMASPSTGYDAELRDLFRRDYSCEAAKSRIESIMSQTDLWNGSRQLQKG